MFEIMSYNNYILLKLKIIKLMYDVLHKICKNSLHCRTIVK